MSVQIKHSVIFSSNDNNGMMTLNIKRWKRSASHLCLSGYMNESILKELGKFILLISKLQDFTDVN